jgi:cyanophycinase-like exopeptidase
MITRYILLFVGIIILISACNPASEKNEPEENETKTIDQQVFLIGNGPNSKGTINDMIEKSGIRKGGYIVIIPTSFNASDSTAWFLKKEFFIQKIMAVHILEFHPDSAIKNTDILAIKNASIICLLNGKKNRFMRLANNTRLKKSLLNAKENGTLIAGIGKGAPVLGDYYYSKVMDSVSQKLKIKLKPGLGLLKNTVIDNITFFRNYREVVQKNSTRKNFVFIGLGNKSCIWIKNDDALVLRKPKIGFIAPGKPKKTYGKEARFKLLPQEAK